MTRDYYTFDGWYTAKDGGDEVTEASILDCSENITLYAHWELKPLSDWVKATEMPEDAMPVESKWNYTYTSDSPLDSSTDYSILSESSSWSDYGSWSSWSKSSVSGSDSRQVETKTVTDSSGYTQYRYWRYRQSGSTKVHWCANLGEKYWGGTWYKEYTDWQNSQMSIIEANSGKCSCCGTVNTYGSSTNPYYWEETRWIDPVTHIEYRYRDRHIIYIYNLESSANPTGQANVSDVQEWVRYRSK